MITLYQFHPLWGLPNASSFCLKIETLLKMYGLEYQNKYISDPRPAPKHKCPYADINGVIVPDSNFILDYLREHCDVRLDAHLSDEQKAQATAFTRLIEEHLYWIVVYSRWSDQAWFDAVKPAFFGHLKAPLRFFIPQLLRRKMLKDIYANGIGHHSRDEVYHLGQQDIDALANFLGDKDYCFNNQPSTLDAIIYATIINIIKVPVESPLKDYTLTKANLVDFANDMHKRYFPEYQ